MRRQIYRKIFKLMGVLAIASVLFLGIAAYTFYRLVQLGELRRFLIQEVENLTQLKVSAGEAGLTIGKVMGVSLRDLVLFEPKGQRLVMRAQRVLIRVALLPLLRRRLVFSEIRLYRPTLQVTRDEWGELPLLGGILGLLSRNGEEGEFTLDLDGIRVEGGEILLREHQKDLVPTVTRLREIDLILRRVPTKGPSSPAPAKEVTAPGGEEATLMVSLKAAIEKDGKRVGVTSRGRIVFPGGGSEWRQAWFDLDTSLERFPANLFWNYYGHLLPFKTVQGTLSPRLRWQGRLAERVHVQGEVDFAQIELHAPDIFAYPLTPGDGRLRLAVELTPNEIRLQSLDLRSSEIALAARGSVQVSTENDPYLEVHLTAPFVPLLAARKYIPQKILGPSQWGKLISTADRGRVRLVKAGVAGRLSQIRRLSEPGFEEHIWLEAELLDAGGSLTGDPALPVRGISGRIVLEKGVLYYRHLKGSYGPLRLAEVDGIHKGILTGRGLLQLRARGEADLSQLRGQLRAVPIPPHVAKAVAALEELGGTGKFRLSLRTDFASLSHYEGQLALENARLRIGEFSLSRLRANLSFSPKEMRAEKVTALLAGSPVHIRLYVKPSPPNESTFDLMIESSGVRAGVVNRLLLSSGSLQDPGTVRGTVRYQGSLVSAQERRVNGALEIGDANLPWKFFAQPLHVVSGRVGFDDRGIDLRDLKGRVETSEFEFSGQWQYGDEPQLTFSLSSPQMDLAHLLPQEEANSDWSGRLKAKGRVHMDKGRYEGFEFSNLSTDLALDKGRWRLENFVASSLGGGIRGHGSFIYDSDGLWFAVAPRIQGIPIHGFLNWFDLGTARITGKINLSGNLESSGKTGPERKGNLSGAFQLRVEDGVVRGFKLLVRILSLLDLSRWFSLKMPDVNQEGIQFHSITGDFRVNRGVYATQNFLLDSKQLRITGAGEVNGPKGEIDFVIAVRPFPGMDSAVNFIPLIGPGLAGIKNSLLVASFRVRGPIENPAITPAPLKTLSEFFFSALSIPKELLGPLGEEQK